MAGDALERRYRDSLLKPHPLRGNAPAIPIDPRLLAAVCHEIQFYGALRLPADFAPPATRTETAELPGARIGGLEGPGVKIGNWPQTKPAGAALSVYGLAPSLRLLETLATELQILWKLYEEMVADEYTKLGTNPVTRKTAFPEFEQRGGLKHYRELRPVYFRAKIREPHQYLIDFLDTAASVSLAGVEVQQGVHKEFAKMLKKADSFLTSTPVPGFGVAPIKYIGCFRPSDLAPARCSTLRRLSNNMIGAAVDIDSVDNPHLKKPQLDAIDAIFDQRVQEGHAPLTIKAGRSWLAGLPQNGTPKDRAIALHKAIMDISREVKEFLDQYLDDWIKFVVTPSTPQDPQAQKEQERRLKEDYPLLEKLAQSFGIIRPDARTTFEKNPWREGAAPHPAKRVRLDFSGCSWRVSAPEWRTELTMSAKRTPCISRFRTRSLSSDRAARRRRGGRTL